MDENIQKLFGRLFVVRGQVYVIAGAFGAGFISGQPTYVDGGQTVV